MNGIIEKFQEMLNAKFWSLWGDSLYDDWDSWLEENNIKKMRDNSQLPTAEAVGLPFQLQATFNSGLTDGNRPVETARAAMFFAAL